jgi:SAM-dependent methyltransferase
MDQAQPNSKRYTAPEGYYELTKNRPASEFLVEAMKYRANKNGIALDFGCGAGNETKYLLDSGHEVTAVDGNKDAEKYIKALYSHGKVHFVKSDFETFKFGSYDFINASRALPFVHKNAFNDVFSRLKGSLKPRGIFVGDFYGVNDQWNKSDETMTFVAKNDLERLLKGMQIIRMEEKEEDGAIANGNPKHWHVFHVIARKL